jgi:hypothetical protein
MVTYTSDQLLESIRNLAGAGDNASTGTTDDNILRHINETLREKILPEISIIREDYFIQRGHSSPVNGRVRIHSRAAWNRLRDLYYMTAGDSRLKQVDPVEMDAIHLYTTTGGPFGYYLEGNDIVLVGGAPASSVVEQAFIFRPGELVDVTETRLITAVDALTKTITLDDDVPVDWDSTLLFDVHSPESGAEIIDWSLVAATVTGPSIVFTSEIDGSVFGRKPLAVGQYIVLEGESAVPGIPREWVPLLIRSVAARLAEAIADEVMIRAHGSVAEAMIKLNKANAEQRVESKPMRVLGRRGALRAARGWW